jgi:hypothetical protein
MKRTFVVVALAGLFGGGCPASDDSSASADGNSNGDSTGGDATDAVVTLSGGSMTDAVATGDGSGTGPVLPPGEETGNSFITMQDGGGIANECDQWSQDCPVGEKCMPWANDGGNSWNALRCTPLQANPGQIGDDCMVEGSGVTGLDNCDIGSMCYYVDPETAVGQCVGMCLGTPEAPQCDPGFLCSISNNGVLTLCRAECDPLLQDCDGSACLPAAGADGFVCIVDASGDAGAAGDACEFLNSCDPGLFCGDAAALPDCAGSGCCTEFCDLTDPMPDAACSLSAGGAACTPWFEPGSAPPDLDHVGACVIPA